MIIALCGNKGAGKNTIAQLIVELFSSECEIRTIAFADPIKSAVQHIFKLETTTDDAYDTFKRSVHQINGHSIDGRWMGREIGMLMRSYDVNQFTAYVNAAILQSPNSLWIVTDLRFDNEYEFLTNKQAFIMRVDRNTGDHSNNDHISERGFRDDQVDVIINNNFSKEQVKQYLKALLQEKIKTHKETKYL